jgi:low affinity Fe/Cu permease
MEKFFAKIASQVAKASGTAWCFISAILVVLVWAVTGPMFHYSETWQLVINTGTTIVTFLMVFLIQNTQNRDARALHLKLDELLIIHKKARNEMVDIEELSCTELEEIADDIKKTVKKGVHRNRDMPQADSRM